MGTVGGQTYWHGAFIHIMGTCEEGWVDLGKSTKTENQNVKQVAKAWEVLYQNNGENGIQYSRPTIIGTSNIKMTKCTFYASISRPQHPTNELDESRAQRQNKHFP